MPSSSGGFGSNSQANHAVIASTARDLTHGLRITPRNFGNPYPLERSLTAFGMTHVFIWRNSMPYSVTLIFPPTPRPFTFRSYIDSAKIGGTVNSPRLDDLI